MEISTNSRGRFMVSGGGGNGRTWKIMWRKLMREKRRMFDHHGSRKSNCRRKFKVPYDEFTYKQNFDQGLAGCIYNNIDQDQDLERDIMSRSFSIRYADPSTPVSVILVKPSLIDDQELIILNMQCNLVKDYLNHKCSYKYIEMPYISHNLILLLFMAIIMKHSRSNMFVIVLQIALIFILSLEPIVAQVGVSYGMMGDNLPTKPDVIALYKQNGIQRLRLYDPNPEALQALGGSDIEVSVGVLNADIEKLASSQDEANTWVQNNIKNYPSVKFKYIVVGNEFQLQFILSAMQNLLTAVSDAGLINQIRVTTAVHCGLLGESYPPSKGVFSADANEFITPIAKFLALNGSPLFLNVYPYFAYSGSNGNVALDYALFNSPGIVVNDNALGYQNLLDAMIDAFYWALEKAGAGSVEIVVSETGWPTSGGNGASLENQKSYILKLIDHVKSGRGTPKKPGKLIETYIFAMFDENQKTPEYEKFWGLFTPDKQIKYPINFA
ncbi:glucan endo-1,3-beta-glucosidase, basic isoform-like [Impatiens glandulifera]|uniref:glucan endo-1,3-beta-glucosidase, basic isoform-like n=1 Tax=Impatiens glandulifera TaxID=253017 RepID=UPI001FB0F975|nr:glucan endo-1,3-beta-glucosidase, basic isoform-like [Impatiens glandulifera]